MKVNIEIDMPDKGTWDCPFMDFDEKEVLRRVQFGVQGTLDIMRENDERYGEITLKFVVEQREDDIWVDRKNWPWAVRMIGPEQWDSCFGGNDGPILQAEDGSLYVGV